MMSFTIDGRAFDAEHTDQRVRAAFDDFGGSSVFHCHILDRENLGMMGTLEAR